MKAIEVRDISKIYPLYTNKYDKLKEAILPGNRKFHKDFHEIGRASCRERVYVLV